VALRLFLLLASTAAVPAFAQTAPQLPPAPATAPPAPETGSLPGTIAEQTPAISATTPPAGSPSEAAAATPEAQGEAGEGEDIVVTGRKPVGSVVGDIPPEQTLSPADIRSYGVSSVADLLTELSPQTRSGRGSGGAPVVLLNGRRIGGFSEIRDLPTEAILRVEILPEEVALKYGYRADQRVVNFVLRPRFRAYTGELIDTLATDGGRNQPGARADWLRIQRTGRTSVHLEYDQASALTEAERSIIQAQGGASSAGTVTLADGTTLGAPASAANGAVAAGDFLTTVNPVDQSRFRTLLPETKSFQANGVYATSLTDRIGATFNARVQHDVSDADRGLVTGNFLLPVGNPFSPFASDARVSRAFPDLGALGQHVESTDAHLGASANGDQGRWRWTVNANADYSASDTRSQTGLDTTAFQSLLTASDPGANPFGAFDLLRTPDNLGRSRSTNLALDTLVTGPVFSLPAGDANTSIRIGASSADFTSRSTRAGVTQPADISRDIGNAQVNLDLPIASRTRGVLSVLGDFSLNANVAADHLSDFGTLWTLGYGANWSPLRGLRLIYSVTHEDEAPSAQQLGNPQVPTAGVRVFDYVRGTTATVTTVTGGNPFLRADERHVTKLGATLQPWSDRDINVIANYVTERVDDPIASFPAASAAIEAAFRDRFTRVNGDLVRLDTRPVNFARSERSELRYGFNVSFKLKSKIQKELGAFRAGTGPNPFAGLRPPGGRRRDGDGAPADATRPDGSGARAAANGGEQPRGGDAPGGGRGPGGGFGGGRGGFGGGRFGGGGGAAAGGRVQFALYHTWHFTDRVTIADGGPVLDLLNGDAIGGSGGQSRHELEGQAGYSNNGLGARASLNFQSATRVNGGTPTSPQTLDFGSLTTVNLRLFADFSQRIDLIRAHPWLRGTRVTLSLNNAFNQRQRVTDQTGTVPIGFQPGYLDPLGRTVRLSIRKLFF
jgi:iron complex outermembrane receptor protein